MAEIWHLTPDPYYTSVPRHRTGPLTGHYYIRRTFDHLWKHPKAFWRLDKISVPLVTWHRGPPYIVIRHTQKGRQGRPHGEAHINLLGAAGITETHTSIHQLAPEPMIGWRVSIHKSKSACNTSPRVAQRSPSPKWFYQLHVWNLQTASNQPK
jgi:hypothetical protein